MMARYGWLRGENDGMLGNSGNLREQGRCAVLHPGVRGCTRVYTSDGRFALIRVLTSTRQRPAPLRTPQ